MHQAEVSALSVLIDNPWDVGRTSWGERGLRAPKRAGRAGRKARLRAKGLRRTERGLKRGPQVLGYESGLWTSGRVAHLIEKECGVCYHAGHA